MSTYIASGTTATQIAMGDPSAGSGRPQRTRKQTVAFTATETLRDKTVQPDGKKKKPDAAFKTDEQTAVQQVRPRAHAAAPAHRSVRQR